MFRFNWILIWPLYIILTISLVILLKREPVFKISSDEQHFNASLESILKPRWVQSEGHNEVSEFLTNELDRLGYSVIFGERDDPFSITNIIAITNLMAKRFLLMSCHYDSKFLESLEFFVSATDAGVSCAILLNLAKTLTNLPELDLLKRVDIGLIFAFFDGHESIGGIYDGSHPLLGSENFVKTEVIPLSSINAVITLNLIGAPNHIYLSKYESTSIFHVHMANIEEELKKSGQLQQCHQLFYKLKDHESDIEDDHYPFLQAGIPVMHIVPHTYPEVWLQETDNIENLHWPTIRNMNAIITRFVYDYFKHYTVK